MIKGWYCKEKLDANNSEKLRNWGERGCLLRGAYLLYWQWDGGNFGGKSYILEIFFFSSITGEKLDYQCWLPSWWAQWHFPKQYSTSSSLVSCVVDNTLWTTMTGSLQCFYTLFQMVSGYLFPFSVWWP